MLVNIESPFSGNMDKNIAYARKCMHDCLKRGEFPIASHLLYTQPNILDDTKPEERELGIKAGFAWNKHAEKTVVYIDHGITDGMNRGIENAKINNRNIEYRRLYAEL